MRRILLSLLMLVSLSSCYLRERELLHQQVALLERYNGDMHRIAVQMPRRMPEWEYTGRMVCALIMGIAYLCFEYHRTFHPTAPAPPNGG
jgi:hypothetical protein